MTEKRLFEKTLLQVVVNTDHFKKLKYANRYELYYDPLKTMNYFTFACSLKFVFINLMLSLFMFKN